MWDQGVKVETYLWKFFSTLFSNAYHHAVIGIPGINNYSDNKCKENKASGERNSGELLWTPALTDTADDSLEGQGINLLTFSVSHWLRYDY